MVSARRNNICAPPNEYQQERDANVAIVRAKLQSLNIPKMTKERHDQPKKRKERPHTTVAERETRNLRPKPPRNFIENANEEIDEDLDCEPVGEFLCANQDVQTSPHKKREGRGITRMEEVFARTPDMPKVKIELNEFDQPVGPRARELASVIGCLVRKISVQCSDWRLVDIKKKNALWNDIKAKYDIHDDGMWWVLRTTRKMWKEFKAHLKKQYFDDRITNEQLKKRYGDRVNDSDWNYLTTHWMSPDFEVRTEISKANRSKAVIHHTSGTKSFARSRHELGRKLGRPPRRDEVYIETHTRKNGVPTPNAEPIINKLKEIVEAQPELKERTIEQGDALAAVCGAKEPRGRVRTLGLGPTPQDVRIAGLKCYPSTRFQMEVLARKTAQQRIIELEEQMKRQEERHAEEKQNLMEVMSHNGSNSRHHVSPRSVENVDDAHHHVAPFQEDEDYGDNEDHDACPEEGEYLFERRRPAALAMQLSQRSLNSAANTVQTHANSPHQCTPNDTTDVAQHHASLSHRRFSNNAAPTTQHGATHEVQPNASFSHRRFSNNAAPTVQHGAAHEVQPNATPIVANNEAQEVQANATQRAKPVQPEVGMKVILYEVVRSDARVALGTIISTNPKTIIGGVALGKQYCEVVVNHVLKRDAILPRPYPGVEKMVDAHMLSIAWPNNRVKQQATKMVRKTSKLPLVVSAEGEKSSKLIAGGEKS